MPMPMIMPDPAKPLSSPTPLPSTFNSRKTPNKKTIISISFIDGPWEDRSRCSPNFGNSIPYSRNSSSMNPLALKHRCFWSVELEPRVVEIEPRPSPSGSSHPQASTLFVIALKNLLSVDVALLFGVDCGMLIASTIYFVWSLFSNRHEFNNYKFDVEDNARPKRWDMSRFPLMVPISSPDQKSEMAPSWSASSHPSKNVKFYNKHCSCGYRCSVKISESKENPNRLYFCCQSKNKCSFFEWWEAPEDLHDNRGMGDECTGVSYFEKNVDDKWKDVTNELKILNLKMNGLVIFCVCLLFVVLLK